ncbi:Nitroreductase-like protein [Podospora appendiculata]|uniref:Nitroreductase-like protein n=1 Tax=Podospora appendiculata TaxID=314037 RepID=A0AAE0X5G7_9PEZI|nr:Nitroreductase-like protein [Podospora appendiculata]
MQRATTSIARALPSSFRIASKPRRAATALQILRQNTPLSARSYATTPATMSATPISANAVLDLIKNRRTYYPLSKDLTITPARIEEIVKEALQHVPSSFNSQSNRVVVLFGAEHEKLWDFTTEILKAIVPTEAWAGTGGKMAMFKAAAGTVLFFEDQAVVEGMQAKFALYADRFPVWAAHSDAMLQHTVWTALEAEGLGANLQHYNPLVDAKIAEEWKVPSTWKLAAQLVFGGKTGEAGEKAFNPVEEKFKSFGA